MCVSLCAIIFMGKFVGLWRRKVLQSGLFKATQTDCLTDFLMEICSFACCCRQHEDIRPLFLFTLINVNLAGDVHKLKLKQLCFV